jgi:hypothetical protein
MNCYNENYLRIGTRLLPTHMACGRTEFSLAVNDLGIKYVGNEHAEQLKASTETHYQISCDWMGSAYCWLKLDWDYFFKNC